VTRKGNSSANVDADEVLVGDIGLPVGVEKLTSTILRSPLSRDGRTLIPGIEALPMGRRGLGVNGRIPYS
jgi:hypothetical protein